jgi:hypothetical protein
MSRIQSLANVTCAFMETDRKKEWASGVVFICILALLINSTEAGNLLQRNGVLCLNIKKHCAELT